MKILIVGAGAITRDYIKLFLDLKFEPVVVGRSESTVSKLSNDYKLESYSGGIENFFKNNTAIFSHAVVAVGIEELYAASMVLVRAGVKNILIEKPGALSLEQIQDLESESLKAGVRVAIAYNRRFYENVEFLLEKTRQDGGITSIFFEFTEWSHQIEKLDKKNEVKAKWLLGNSSHVIDLAFYLAGKPKEFCAFTSGSLDWHPSASVFVGAGTTEQNILFNYCANWDSSGRWGLEVCTKNYKFILRPLEELQFVKRGSVLVEKIEFQKRYDSVYKPGFYLQMQAFLNHSDKLCTLSDQVEQFKILNKIANY